MRSRPLFQSRGLAIWLALTMLPLVLLSACGGTNNQPTTQRPKSSPTVAITITPGPARIQYPWKMMQRQNPFTGTTEWVPVDAQVYQELENDFLGYWTWSGQNAPASFPFLPDANQIAFLSTPNFRGNLQNYVNQIYASGRVVAYMDAQNLIDGQPPQQVVNCTQDGLQCQSYYQFPSATKTTLDAQTGKIIAQTGPISHILLATQTYNKEEQRWQLSDLLSQDFPN
jgi:hypothetical protein